MSRCWQAEVLVEVARSRHYDAMAVGEDRNITIGEGLRRKQVRKARRGEPCSNRCDDPVVAYNRVMTAIWERPVVAPRMKPPSAGARLAKTSRVTSTALVGDKGVPAGRSVLSNCPRSGPTTMIGEPSASAARRACTSKAAMSPFLSNSGEAASAVSAASWPPICRSNADASPRALSWSPASKALRYMPTTCDTARMPAVSAGTTATRTSATKCVRSPARSVVSVLCLGPWPNA